MFNTNIILFWMFHSFHLNPLNTVAFSIKVRWGLDLTFSLEEGGPPPSYLLWLFLFFVNEIDLGFRARFRARNNNWIILYGNDYIYGI